MPDQCIELHDSQLAVLFFGLNDEAVLVFSALYIHQSDGRPGIDPGIGWFQRGEIVIDNASLPEVIRDWPCEIFSGEAIIDGTVHKNCIPLPLNCETSFKIMMQAQDDKNTLQSIEISGDGVELTLLGKRGHSEEFPGSD